MTPAPVSHPAAGIACVLAGVLCLTLSDALAKWLGAHYAPLQILFLRAALALPLITVLVLAQGGPKALHTHYPGVHFVRAILNVAAAATFYQGLTLMPLAEATAIAFTAPLFVIALSGPMLRERVDAARWVGALVGFTGVLLVVRPGAASFQNAALLPLATALFYALMMITSRRIGPGDSIFTTMFYIALGQACLTVFVQPWLWRPIQMADLPAFGGVALFSTLGLTLLTQGFRIGPPAVVAPFDYTGLLWATLLGWLFWNELPDVWAGAGAIIIVGSGLYIGWRAMR